MSNFDGSSPNRIADESGLFRSYIKADSLLVHLPEVPPQLAVLNAWVQSKEAGQGEIKDDNESRIVWHNSAHPNRTDYSIVYLHGFTASQGEVASQHRRLAQAFGCNLYLPRLPGHGSSAHEAMRGLTAQQLIDASAEALSIGQSLGDKVILIGGSLGASLAINLAAKQPKAIAAVVAWSPGIRPFNEKALLDMCDRNGTILLEQPAWSAEQRRYWSSVVHSDGYRSLAELFYVTMNQPTFAQVTAPFFMAYHYGDESHQDQTASVPAMLAMYEQLGTPSALKHKQAFPNGAHVIASPYRSADAEHVYQATYDFLKRILLPSKGQADINF